MTIRRSKKKKWTLLKFGLFIYFVAGVFALIWCSTQVTSLEYELGELNRQKTSFLREQKFVAANRANFLSARNIEETAVNVLGMSPPDRKNIFYVGRTEEAGLYKVAMEKR
ncbi:MAG: hypothetical protein Q7U10_04735 [Thermodesulfovibrionia bacterium]|nr:hypothetical protein [Thermodesulfovibrionia bacterium]